jgi:hypothetical protein
MKNLGTNRTFISIALITQFIPILIFTPEVYDLSSQVWWLAVLLAFLDLVAVIQLLARGTYAPWPWYLIGFAQGFNIISRLMMFFPHITENQAGTQVLNGPYAVIGVIAMLWSALLLGFFELPEVRNIMIKN